MREIRKLGLVSPDGEYILVDEHFHDEFEYLYWEHSFLSFEELEDTTLIKDYCSEGEVIILLCGDYVVNSKNQLVML
jgi:hypothetical protein